MKRCIWEKYRYTAITNHITTTELYVLSDLLYNCYNLYNTRIVLFLIISIVNIISGLLTYVFIKLYVSILTLQEQSRLSAALNRGIAALKQEGKLDALYRKWWYVIIC